MAGLAQRAVTEPVSEVDREPDRGPHEEPDPGVMRQREHHARADERARDADEPGGRHLERAPEVGTRVAQHEHADADGRNRSTRGAHKNFKPYSNVTQETNPIVLRSIPSLLNRSISVFS